MSNLFLIAHKVHGEPAFDVATRMECPECMNSDQLDPPGSCSECDSLGFWWIIPTSGHRAYPYWDRSFSEMETCQSGCVFVTLPDEMPPDLPDHYIHREAPKVDLATALGIKPKVEAKLSPIVRRL